MSGFLSQSLFCTAALSWQTRLSLGAKVIVDYNLEKYYWENNNPQILSLEDWMSQVWLVDCVVYHSHFLLTQKQN